jgi:hypothetical protein
MNKLSGQLIVTDKWPICQGNERAVDPAYPILKAEKEQLDGKMTVRTAHKPAFLTSQNGFLLIKSYVIVGDCCNIDTYRIGLDRRVCVSES